MRPIVVPEGTRAITIPEGMEIKGDFKISAIEGEVDKEHRHRMEVREFWVKEAPVHLVAIAIVVVGTLVSLVFAFRPGSPPEDKKWAVSVLSYLLMAVAGFAFGKAAK